MIELKLYGDPRVAESVLLTDVLENIERLGFLKKKAATTMDREKYSRKNLERLLGEETPLSEIDAMVINEYQYTRLEEKASHSSIRQELSMLSRMFIMAR